jgi:hypothetical protein
MDVSKTYLREAEHTRGDAVHTDAQGNEFVRKQRRRVPECAFREEVQIAEATLRRVPRSHINRVGR